MRASESCCFVISARLHRGPHRQVFSMGSEFSRAANGTKQRSCFSPCNNLSAQKIPFRLILPPSVFNCFALHHHGEAFNVCNPFSFETVTHFGSTSTAVLRVILARRRLKWIMESRLFADLYSSSCYSEGGLALIVGAVWGESRVPPTPPQGCESDFCRLSYG